MRNGDSRAWGGGEGSPTTNRMRVDNESQGRPCTNAGHPKERDIL
jgi:hypothetical protein